MTHQHFEVQCHTELELDRRHADKERPPKSAKLVVDLVFGPSPGGGGDYRIYLLSTNRERSTWILWLKVEDADGKPIYDRIATGRPYRGVPAKVAAELLLSESCQRKRVERQELEWGDFVQNDLIIINAGLLNEHDIRRIFFGK
jgi:hypothetical protein